MRTIDRTTKFKRDFKREIRGRYRDALQSNLEEALDYICRDVPLPDRFKDHSLSGEWADHRDCHLRPDLVMIYRLSSVDVVVLVRLGSHSELSL